MTVWPLFVGLGVVFALCIAAAVLYDNVNGFDVEDD